jgi:hypothetical protein
MSGTDGHPPACITERQTDYGYWWRYTHSAGEPEDTWLAATGIAASVAAEEARKSGKTYLVLVSLEPLRAVFVFASDHPDTRNPDIHTALTGTPGGERIRHRVTRH